MGERCYLLFLSATMKCCTSLFVGVALRFAHYKLLMAVFFRVKEDATFSPFSTFFRLKSITFAADLQSVS